jgi:uncharacterized membrane protein YoaK (UPF0700 family)
VFKKRLIPIALGFNGGFVDAAGFLALNGLFTAHITGNFVTLGAAIITGSTGTIDKALALPVFCAVILFVRLARYFLLRIKANVFGSMLTLMLLLLSLGAILTIQFAPFEDGNSAMAVCTGLIFVAAMAIQNAVHRVHLATAPPTTVMTTTITQVMLDIADLLHGVSLAQKAPIYIRLKSMISAIIIFAIGCACGAISFYFLNMWCFVVPPMVLVYPLLADRLDKSEKQVFLT